MKEPSARPQISHTLAKEKLNKGTTKKRCEGNRNEV